MKIIKKDGSKQAFNSGIYVIHTPENYIYIGQSINLNKYCYIWCIPLVVYNRNENKY